MNMKKVYLFLLASSLMSTLAQLEAYRIDNQSDQTIHVYVLKNMSDGGAILLSKGWSTKSLEAISAFVSVAEKFAFEARFINWGIRFLSHFSTDALAEIVAHTLSLHTHLYIAPQGHAQWSADKIKARLHDPQQSEIFFMIFPTSSYGSIDYDAVLFMGLLNLNGHYIYTHNGKLYDAINKKFIKFMPFRRTPKGTVVPLSPEEQYE